MKNNALDLAFRVVLSLAALGLLGAGTVVCYRGLYGAGGTIYAAAVLVLIFAFLTRFKRFKGFGIEGELWEEKQEEAAHLVDALRGLTFTLATRFVSVIARLGRWDSAIPRREQYDLVQRLRDDLLRGGMTRETVEAAFSDWHRYNGLDLAMLIYQRIYEFTQRKENSINAELQKLPLPLDTVAQQQQHELIERRKAVLSARDRSKTVIAHPDIAHVARSLQHEIERMPEATAEERQSLFLDLHDRFADLEQYANNRTFRRIDVWFAEDPMLK